MSSILGQAFTVSTFGESHGRSVGAVIDGCPARIPVSESDLQVQMDRRRPGQSDLTTPRRERDRVRILSGVENGLTLGTPVALVVDNEDARPGDYSELATVPRPSHADYTYRVKYGIQAQSGGGRASARETVGRVAAGAVAERFLASAHGVEIVAFVSSVGGIDAGPVDLECVSRTDVDGSPVRCPVSESAERMADLIRVTAVAGDSLGGIVTCVCRNVPAGWGEPVFHKIGAVLGLAMLSIPAVKGFEVGSGFAGTAMKGSVHNDAFCWKNGRLGTVTNHSGGIQGGITNGEPVVFRVAFKPVATIRCEQLTVDYEGKPARLKLEKGRHDSCVLPRAVPVVEAMAALVLADMALLSKRYDASRHV